MLASISVNYYCNPDKEEDEISKILTGITVTSKPSTTTYKVGETFNSNGLMVTASYSDLSTADVTSSVTLSSPDMTTPGTKTVTVSYTEDSVTATASFDIKVNEASSALTVEGATYVQATYTSYVIKFETDSTGYETNGTKKAHFTYTISGSTITFVRDPKDGDSNDFYSTNYIFNYEDTVTGTISDDFATIRVKYDPRSSSTKAFNRSAGN